MYLTTPPQNTSKYTNFDVDDAFPLTRTLHRLRCANMCNPRFKERPKHAAHGIPTRRLRVADTKKAQNKKTRCDGYELHNHHLVFIRCTEYPSVKALCDDAGLGRTEYVAE